MRRTLKNAYGRLKGFGNCHNCGNTWDWAKGHTFYFTQGRGAFPICEDCWVTASDEDIIKATIKMIDIWVEQSDSYYRKKQSYKDGQSVLEQVKIDLKKRNKKKLIHRLLPFKLKRK